MVRRSQRLGHEAQLFNAFHSGAELFWAYLGGECHGSAAGLVLTSWRILNMGHLQEGLFTGSRDCSVMPGSLKHGLIMRYVRLWDLETAQPRWPVATFLIQNAIRGFLMLKGRRKGPAWTWQCTSGEGERPHEPSHGGAQQSATAGHGGTRRSCHVLFRCEPLQTSSWCWFLLRNLK